MPAVPIHRVLELNPAVQASVPFRRLLFIPGYWKPLLRIIRCKYNLVHPVRGKRRAAHVEAELQRVVGNAVDRDFRKHRPVRRQIGRRIRIAERNEPQVGGGEIALLWEDGNADHSKRYGRVGLGRRIRGVGKAPARPGEAVAVEHIALQQGQRRVHFFLRCGACAVFDEQFVQVCVERRAEHGHGLRVA